MIFSVLNPIHFNTKTSIRNKRFIISINLIIFKNANRSKLPRVEINSSVNHSVNYTTIERSIKKYEY